MRVFLLAALIWAAQSPSVFAQQSEPGLARMMEHVANYQWSDAVDKARGADAIERDIVWWHALRGGYGNFADVQDFLTRRPDWPGLPLLRQVGEATIPEDADPDSVIGYFTGQLPRSAKGSLRLAAALEKRGASAIAADEIRRAWLLHDLNADDLQTYLELHGTILVGLAAERMDRLLWEDRLDQAELMIPLVPSEQAALGRARLALMRGEDGVDELIAAVPVELANNPGLAHARFKWRLTRGRREDAADLIVAQSRIAGGLGVAEAWSGARLDLARRALQDGDARLAYELSTPHGLSAGEDFAALEWFAGYVALQALGDAERALDHFRRFRIAVDTPISLSRAGYWEGRALEALKEDEAAHHAFEFASEYATAFYGQLAAARIGLQPADVLPLNRAVPELARTALAQSSVLTAARALHEVGETALYRRFLRHLAEAGTPPEQAALGQLALDMGEPYTALYIAKYAADHGNMLLAPYFPTIELPADLPADPALIMAIVRRESEFSAQAISRADARGLMQVMPGTAQDVADDLDLSLVSSDLIEQPMLNLKIGSTYLAQLIKDFDGYLPAILAAYNAGPTRAESWRKIRGFGAQDVDRVVDWVESVPFAETRNYIMRVAEGYQVYRVTMGNDAEWVLPNLLTGQARVGGG